MDAALKAGYRLFDTAKYYKNEPELGAALEVSILRSFARFYGPDVGSRHSNRIPKLIVCLKLASSLATQRDPFQLLDLHSCFKSIGN